MKRKFYTTLASIVACFMLSSVASAVTFEECVLAPSSVALTFTQDATYPWAIQGDTCVKSGNYQVHNSSSSFSATVTVEGTTTFSFDWLVKSEGSDWLRFYIDDKPKAEISGTSMTAFATVSYVITKGTHTLRWAYTKDHSTHTSDDAGYVKNIKLDAPSAYTTVTLTESGTLGAEVLKQHTYITDVTKLKVIGAINSDDWVRIKAMTSLIALDLSECVTTGVPASQFSGNSLIREVTLPNGLLAIGEKAFLNSAITLINLPNGLESIEYRAFYNCDELLDVAIPNSVKTLGTEIFNGCNYLRSATLPTGCSKIPYAMFSSCSRLVSVTIPDNYTIIGEEGFAHCTILPSIAFPKNLLTIERSAFYGCDSIKELSFPEGTTSIYSSVFYGCNSLNKLRLPQSLTGIGDNAFNGCDIDTLIIPDKVQSIGSDAFINNRNLKCVTLSASIADYPRLFYYANNIDRIICKCPVPPTISSDPFPSAVKSSVTLLVPDYAVSAYKLSTYWSQFGSISNYAGGTGYVSVKSNMLLAAGERINGGNSVDIDMSYGSSITVEGSSTMPIGLLSMSMGRGDFTSGGYYDAAGNYINSFTYSPSSFISRSPAVTADSLQVKYSFRYGRWYFVSLPFDAKISEIKSDVATSAFVFRYYNSANRALNGTGSSWTNVEGDTLYANRGYIFQCSATCTFTIVATDDSKNSVFTADDFTLPLVSYDSDNSENANWNFIGNPYLSYFDISKMNYTAPITVWNVSNNNYEAYSVVDDDLALFPMQGFFVQKPADVSSIVFDEAGRQVNSTINAASGIASRTKENSNRKVVNLMLKNGEMSDRARVVLNEERTTGYDLGSDASKFMSMESVPQLYSHSDGIRYAINERPYATGDANLGFVAPTTGRYTIYSTRNDNDAMLVDTYTGKSVLLDETGYSFDTEAGVYDSRFKLKLNPVTKVQNLKNGEPVVRVTDGGIVVNGDASVEIYNMVGCKVTESIKASNGLFIELERGAYIIKVNRKAQKVLVK